MKRSVKKLLIWTSCIIVILAVGAYIAMDYGVNYALRTIASPEIFSSDSVEESAVEAEHSVQNNESNVDKKEPYDSIAPKEADDSATEVEEEVTQESNVTGDSPVTENNTTTPSLPVVSIDESDSNSTEVDKIEPYSGEITTEKAKKAEDDITFKEKAKVTSTLLSNLDSKDISLFVSLAEGGLTLDEKREAKRIVLQKLDEEEYNELIRIAAKLGLSKGKSYDDSLKEFEE